MKLESLIQYADEYLGIADHPDYPAALNGLQVAGAPDVDRIATAVDASQASIRAAVELGADLLFVHHGIFWDGLRPVTGRHHRRLAALIRADVGLYACHLPLDGHAEVGNASVLGRALGLELDGRFGAYQGAAIGWQGALNQPVGIDELSTRLSTVVDGEVRVLTGGPATIRRVGVVTGAGASFARAAAEAGLDALVTGEASHHHYFDAAELGVHVLLGGHYATETFGVRALGTHLAERFGLRADFIDLPTGL